MFGSLHDFQSNLIEPLIRDSCVWCVMAGQHGFILVLFEARLPYERDSAPEARPDPGRGHLLG